MSREELILRLSCCYQSVWQSAPRTLSSTIHRCRSGYGQEAGGLTKLFNFSAAIAEQEHFGLRPGWLWTILIELGGSVLVLSGYAVWLGAGALGCLTAVAMFKADNFWTKSGQERGRRQTPFLNISASSEVSCSLLSFTRADNAPREGFSLRQLEEGKSLVT